jgi:hypothetical protein
MRIVEATRNGSIKAATMRLVCANPNRGKRALSIIGKMMPPIQPPEMARPVASPRCFRNQCCTVPTAAVNNEHVPNPPITPIHRKNW